MEREAMMEALTHYWVVGHAAQHEIAADVADILGRPPVNPDDVFEGMTDAELEQLCRSYELGG